MSVTADDLSKHAVARDGRGEVVFQGEVMAHSVVPMVLLVDSDGVRFWWRYDMCEVVEVETDAQ